MTHPAGDPDDEQGGDAAFDGDEQLALNDADDDGLPWLEDDAYDEDEGGFDARLIWYGLIGLLVIAGILFGAWWFTRDRADPELAADGSTIAAPEGAYKEAPEDPGGREVEGTGDTAYGVAEGESQRGLLADDSADGSEVPQPSIDREQAGSAASAAEPAAGGSAVYVQIGAFTSRAEADAAWTSASGRFSVLSGMRHRIVEGEVNGARVYRLQVIAGDRAQGDATCRAIRNGGGDCYIR